MKNAVLILLTLISVNTLHAKRPLVLWLHGCLQTPEQFIEQSEIEEITGEVNPVILAPEQSIFANPVKCWNWFLPSLQERERLMSSIVGEIQQLIATGVVDAERVYVGGFSAGSVLATHFSLCYPDVFKGALLHSGAPYKFVNSMFSFGNDEEKLAEWAYECGDHSKAQKLNTVIIFSGTHDLISTATSNELVLQQYLGFFDLVDDQELNDSAVETIEEVGTGRENDKIAHYNMFSGASVSFVSIHRMRHQYSGGNEQSLATSPETLSATQVFLEWTNHFTQ